MQTSPLANTIRFVNMMANDLEPAPIVKGCIWEYGCPYHIEKMLKSLVDDVKTNKENLNKEISKFLKPNSNSTNRNIYKNVDYLAEKRNEFNFSPNNQDRYKKGESSKLDVGKVWDTKLPMLFSYGNENERRTSLGLADISFSDEEFTLGSEMKRMIEAMVES